MSFSLPKSSRLNSRKAIQELFNSGKRINSYPLSCRYLWKSEEESDLQFGVSISKRNFKKAVTRNRIKRLVRESYRLKKNNLEICCRNKNIGLNLFILFIGKEEPSFAAVDKALEHLIGRLLKEFESDEKGE
ncbi:MAG: ribonuclease P protein component [Luteibaculum sp.]